MPTYVYRCKQCGSEFENTERITDEPLKQCVMVGVGGSLCDGEVHRVIQPVGIAFNGSGFHKTDYGKHGPKPASYRDYAKSS